MTEDLDARMRESKRVLVTGASGFIGEQLVAHLQKTGVPTHAVSRSEQPGGRGNVIFERVDMTNLNAVNALIARVRPNIIFHLAGFPTGSRDRSQVFPTFESNLRSTLNVLMATADIGGARIIIPGSMEEPQGDNGVASSPYAM